MYTPQPAAPFNSGSPASRFSWEAVTRQGRVFGFPLAQIVNYLLEPNAELEHDSQVMPKQFTLWFSTHYLILTGWHLDHLQLLRKGQGFTVTASDPRYLNLRPRECLVADVVVPNAGRGASQHLVRALPPELRRRTTPPRDHATVLQLNRGLL